MGKSADLTEKMPIDLARNPIRLGAWNGFKRHNPSIVQVAFTPGQAAWVDVIRRKTIPPRRPGSPRRGVGLLITSLEHNDYRP